MNKTLKSTLANRFYPAALGLLIINFIVFCLSAHADSMRSGPFSGYFLLHYGCAVLVFIFLLIIGSPHKRSIYTIILLLLFISAFALNRDLPVFSTSVTWLSVMLVITGVNFLLFHFWNAMAGWLRCILGFLMGVSTLLLLYLAIYLLPLYPLSLIALIALGISIHTFVPLLLLAQAFMILRVTAFTFRAGVISFSSGFVAALLFTVTYCFLFSAEVQKLNLAYNRSIAEDSGDLPSWVEISREAHGGFIETKVLHTDLLYTLRKWEIAGLGDRPPFNFGNSQLHDPLVVTASTFSRPLEIPEDERVKILESMYDARHEGQEALWSGKDLYTGYVNSKVKIWPKLHLAYTEKVISVTNPNRNRSWPQEAIYTFHLPEGGVVTSLSLWINGKEEKGILTTKEKADTAYRTIVGVEQRDPSVVRWQEGNTVSVRVFPVIPGESRKFRIGFTAPLAVVDKELRYDNIYFDGPPSIHAIEDASVVFAGKPSGLQMPPGFDRRRSGRYKADWKITMKDDGLTPGTFSFNGKAYTIQPYQLERTKVETNAVYLDVNAAWTRREFDEVMRLVSPRPVYVWLDEQMVQIEEHNREECLETLLAHRFSLFPVHMIKSPATSLLISKSTPISPVLADIKGSTFRNDLSAYLSITDLPKLRLLNIGGELSPYLKSLKEHRVFRYESGGILLLKILMDTGTFAADTESQNRVVIDQANVAIVRQDSISSTNTAPDHLMRLFAYNHIMQQTGKGLITGSAGQDTLVAVAKEAYVVSPLSGLIVLETQKDYDRFGIKDDLSSLKNASMKSTGAVPEPHEWALIILVMLTLIYVKFRPKWSKANV